MAGDPAHILSQGCRFADGGLEVGRREKKQSRQQAGAGPCRDPAIPAVGEADVGPIADDDLAADINVAPEDRVAVEDETLRVNRGVGATCPRGRRKAK